MPGDLVQLQLALITTGVILRHHTIGFNIGKSYLGPKFLKVINRIYKLNPICFWLNTRALYMMIYR